MDNHEYKPNSYKSREEQQKQANLPDTEKRVEKVVQGKVQVKKNNIHKFTDVFISEDIANVKSYILMDVLVPAIKKAVSDIVTNGIDMILYGESSRDRNRSSGSKISYVNYYDRKSNERRYDEPRGSTSRDTLGYDDIKFDTRRDAEAVLDQMEALIENFSYVTVADLFDMVDVTAPFTGNRYGWTNISTAEVVSTRDGYRIKLPRASLIDR